MFSGKESRNPAEPPKKKFLPKKFLVEEEGDEDSHNNYYHSYYYHNYKTKPWFLAMFSRYLGALQVASNTAKVLKVRSSKVLLMPLGTEMPEILVQDPLVYFTSKDMDVSEVVCWNASIC